MQAATLTLIASGRLEQHQASWWRPVGERWPLESRPALQMLTLEDALHDPSQATGSVVAALLSDAEPRDILALVDGLYHRGVPAVFVFDRLEESVVRLNSDSVVVLGADEHPEIVAATLRALCQRQPAVEALLHELRTSRRFQTGLRGQMDRVHEELQLAAQVQRDFLPKELPTIAGVDFAVLCRPCGYVSGDIYDIVRLSDQHAGFFIADAIGHGVPAALMTMVIARSLHMTDRCGDVCRIVSPAEALGRLNTELIRRQGESPRFASAVYGVIDGATRRVTIASAGHPMPLRIGRDGIEKVNVEGGLLGVFPDEVYAEATFSLEPGDTLLLHSDGFETAFPDPGADAYGRRLPTSHYVERFVSLAEEVREGAALGSAMDHLAHALDQQTGSLHQVDDLTAIAIAPRAQPGTGVISSIGAVYGRAG